MISAKRPTAGSIRAAHPELTKKQAAAPDPIMAALLAGDRPQQGPEGFTPAPVETIKESGLSDSLVESLVFKHLLASGSDTGRNLAASLGVPPKPIIEMLAQLKARQFVFYKDSTAMGDFDYALTDAGRQRAKGYMEECSYVGVAPVTLEDYVKSVRAQSITLESAQFQNLKDAFSDLLVNDKMFVRLGPAINSGRGLFLYGYPGNGKTSIAERITACFGGDVWVPYAVVVSGELITFYDPENHEPAEMVKAGTLKAPHYDTRWLLIRRPTIVVGGELTMASLDLQHNSHTKITQPSLQLKSNTGTLVIDDFGRQRMRPIELLNRWIIPLEKRYDFLTLSNGKKIKVPFDQLIIFSTNLEPKDLVDEAFLRRIPYKINVIDPSEEEFRKLFGIMAPHLGVELVPEALDRLIEKHYRAVNRNFRCCHPRDLLLQIKNAAVYQGTTPQATEEALDAAVDNYFAVV